MFIFYEVPYFKYINNMFYQCFNSFGTNLGENLINNKSSKFDFGCSIKQDYFNVSLKPQLIIEDAMLVN